MLTLRFDCFTIDSQLNTELTRRNVLIITYSIVIQLMKKSRTLKHTPQMDPLKRLEMIDKQKASTVVFLFVIEVTIYL